jgi:hypothetical protein
MHLRQVELSAAPKTLEYVPAQQLRHVVLASVKGAYCPTEQAWQMLAAGVLEKVPFLQLVQVELSAAPVTFE